MALALKLYAPLRGKSRAILPLGERPEKKRTSLWHTRISSERRATVGKVLSAGIQIKGREAKVLGVIFNCSGSAICADVKVIRPARYKAPEFA